MTVSITRRLVMSDEDVRRRTESRQADGTLFKSSPVWISCVFSDKCRP